MQLVVDVISYKIMRACELSNSDRGWGQGVGRSNKKINNNNNKNKNKEIIIIKKINKRSNDKVKKYI